jgi:nucleoside-specific outer membrane channel protein Tsx
MKTFSLATVLGLTALACLPATAANWSDTYLGYQYSSQFRDPGIAGTVIKNRFELSGVYGWDYGTNFFDVNMLAAEHKSPANTSDGQPQAGVPGDTEVYVVYRSNLDLGKVLKKDLGFGPVREVDFTAGFDFDSTDNQFASNKKFIMAGPQVGFKIDNGFWNLGLGAAKEQNYNGVVHKEVDFKTQYVVFTAWGKTFNLGIPVKFKGWANYLGQKGKDGFGADTKAETVGDAYLLADISRLFGRKPGAVFVGPGYEYWNNKFGDRNFTAPASAPGENNQQVNALMLAAEVHF